MANRVHRRCSCRANVGSTSGFESCEQMSVERFERLEQLKQTQLSTLTRAPVRVTACSQTSSNTSNSRTRSLYPCCNIERTTDYKQQHHLRLTSPLTHSPRDAEPSDESALHLPMARYAHQGKWNHTDLGLSDVAISGRNVWTCDRRFGWCHEWGLGTCA